MLFFNSHEIKKDSKASISCVRDIPFNLSKFDISPITFFISCWTV